jgi:hypothetical protein
MKKTIWLSSFAILVSFALTGALLAKEKDEEEDSEVTIEKTVLAKETGHSFDPVKSFKPGDTFAVLVILSEAQPGTKLKAVWIDTQGEKILEKKIELTEENTKGVEEANRINFTLSHDKPFPTGDYKVEIYLNGELEKTLEFTVKE